MFIARIPCALALTALLLPAAPAWSQQQQQVPPRGPAVSITVTTPDGHSQELTTHESGLATLDVAGHHYAFRPTMYDDAGKQMTVTIFDLGGPDQPVREIAAVEVTGGGAAVATKSAPVFKVQAHKAAQQTGTRPATTSRG